MTDAPQAHSHIGGSVAKRILACPYSLANAHLGAPQKSSNAANEGTALHSLLELYYTGEIDSLQEMVGQVVEGVRLDQEQVNRGVTAALALDAYCDELEEELGQPCEMFFEARVGFGDKIPGAFGTCDVVVKCGPVLAILDYKFGQWIVPVEENAQLLFYGQAAILTIPEFADCTEVDLGIIQPASEPVLRIWPTTPERLKQFEVDLKVAVHEAKSPDPRCETGDHCKWCPLETMCPAKQDLATRALLAKADDVTDVEDLVKWLDSASEIEAFLSAVRAQALAYLEVGVAVPGYKLVERAANRSWVDEAKTIAYAKELGLKTAVYMEKPKLKSPAQFEKVLKTNSIPEELVQKKSSGVTIAPMSDKRRDLNENNFAALARFAEKD